MIKCKACLKELNENSILSEFCKECNSLLESIDELSDLDDNDSEYNLDDVETK